MMQFTKTFLSLMAFAVALPAQSMAEKSEQQDVMATGQETIGFAATAVSNDELSTYRGMATDSTLLFSNMTADLQNNSAINTVSGANSISSGALSNVSGLTSVIQNSGNNVIIQQSTQVNVNFHQ